MANELNNSPCRSSCFFPLFYLQSVPASDINFETDSNNYHDCKHENMCFQLNRYHAIHAMRITTDLRMYDYTQSFLCKLSMSLDWYPRSISVVCCPSVGGGSLTGWLNPL